MPMSDRQKNTHMYTQCFPNRPFTHLQYKLMNKFKISHEHLDLQYLPQCSYIRERVQQYIMLHHIVHQASSQSAREAKPVSLSQPCERYREEKCSKEHLPASNLASCQLQCVKLCRRQPYPFQERANLKTKPMYCKFFLKRQCTVIKI